MNYQINIKVIDKFAKNLLRREKFQMPSFNKIYDIEKELDIKLEPVHPGANDPLLIPYFIVQVPDNLNPQKVIGRIKDCNLIESAYIKPADELPSFD